MDRQAVLHVLALLVVLVLAATGHAVPATACAPLLAGDGGALQPCLDSLPEGATLALPPARYTLTPPRHLPPAGHPHHRAPAPIRAPLPWGRHRLRPPRPPHGRARAGANPSPWPPPASSSTT